MIQTRHIQEIHGVIVLSPGKVIAPLVIMMDSIHEENPLIPPVVLGYYLSHQKNVYYKTRAEAEAAAFKLIPKLRDIQKKHPPIN